jgi:putative hydrolase of the HAD superfamily
MQNIGIIEKKEAVELNLSGIKNIIFDLGGVIIDIHYQKTIEQFKSIGFTDFETIYSQLKQTHLFDLLETGKIPPQSFYMELQKFHNHATNEQIKTAWNSMIGELPYQHVNLLKLLKKRYRTFLLSNTNPIHIEYFLNCIQEKFNYNPLLEMFEHTYYSHEIGYRKPDTNAYNYVLRDAGIKASETVFIDDLEINIAGAKDAGLHTYHLSEQPLQSLFKQF